MSENLDRRLKLLAASAYAGLSVDTLRTRIRHGQLKAERSGPHPNSPIVVRVSELDRMLNEVGHGVHTAPPADQLGITLARIDQALADLRGRVEDLEDGPIGVTSLMHRIADLEDGLVNA